MFYKLLLPFLTFMNSKNIYLTEEFLHNPMFDIVLGVIPNKRNKFVEIVAVAGRYFIIAHERLVE